jgi:hypothetical protein
METHQLINGKEIKGMLRLRVVSMIAGTVIAAICAMVLMMPRDVKENESIPLIKINQFENSNTKAGVITLKILFAFTESISSRLLSEVVQQRQIYHCL